MTISTLGMGLDIWKGLMEGWVELQTIPQIFFKILSHVLHCDITRQASENTREM